MKRPPDMCIIVSSNEQDKGPAGAIPWGFSYAALPLERLSHADPLAATIHNRFDPREHSYINGCSYFIGTETYSRPTMHHREESNAGKNQNRCRQFPDGEGVG